MSLHQSRVSLITSLVLNLVDESSNVRKELDGELVAGFDELLGVLGSADAGRGTGQNYSTGGQSGALGEEADELGDGEDQVTKEIVISFLIQSNATGYTHVRGQSCMTRPLFRPRI